jgi:hypothetical protein
VPSRYVGGSSPGSHVARSAIARTSNRARSEWAWCPGTAAVLLLKSVGGLEERVQVWTTRPWVFAANAMAPPDLADCSPNCSRRGPSFFAAVLLGPCGCVSQTDQNRGYGT